MTEEQADLMIELLKEINSNVKSLRETVNNMDGNTAAIKCKINEDFGVITTMAKDVAIVANRI